MSISIQLPMSLSIERQNGPSLYEISEQRTQRLLSKDKNQATYMGLWDKFKDYFRAEKKAEVIERLYDFIHGNANSVADKSTQNNTSYAKEIFSFLRLKSLATNKHKSDFLITRNLENGLDFYIGSEKIKTLHNCGQFYPKCEAMFAAQHRLKLAL